LEQISGLVGDSYESDILDTTFPGLENQRDILPAFQGLINEERGLTPGFLDSYASCIDEKFQPRVHNGYIELRVEPQDWKSVNADRFVVAQLRTYKEWRYDGKEWSSSSRNVFTALHRRGQVIYIRAEKCDLVEVAGNRKLISSCRDWVLLSDLPPRKKWPWLKDHLNWKISLWLTLSGQKRS
jgi:hypothetical protein